MKARQIVESGSFGPETLKVARRAFDEAWASVASHFGTDSTVIEAARVKLANAVLAMCHEEMGDPIALKKAALGSWHASTGSTSSPRPRGAARGPIARGLSPCRPSSEGNFSAHRYVSKLAAGRRGSMEVDHGPSRCWPTCRRRTSHSVAPRGGRQHHRHGD